MTQIYVKVDLDKHCLDSMIGGSIRRTISNLKTLIGTMTHQGVREVVALTWHDFNCEQLFFLTSSNLQTLLQIIMNNESSVEKLRRIT
jgi:hypothetical protein